MQDIYQDIPRIYTAFAEWGACVAYVMTAGKMNWKKYVGCAGLLIVQSTYLVLTGELSVRFWIPSMVGATVLMYLFLYLMTGVGRKSVLFICTKAFLLAEFVAALEWQIHILGFPSGRGILQADQILFMAVIYLVCFAVVFFQERKIQQYAGEVTGKDCISAVIVTILSFAVGNVCFVIQSMPYESAVRNYLFLIRTVVDLCGVAMLMVLQMRIQETTAEREMSAIHRALKSQYEQYRTYQESFEMLNIKYHDLKHQIAGLRTETDSVRRQEWLDQMERELDVLNDVGHTGNSVLDGILAAKMGYCRKNKIKVTCVANGELLAGIYVADICTIFGNALDNAIECVLLMEDEKKRQIHFSVSKKKQFIFIRIENCCEGELIIGREGLPETVKTDKKEHGYGMKSIRQTAEKYGGTMDYSLQNGWFELKVLLPLAVEEQRDMCV